MAQAWPGRVTLAPMTPAIYRFGDFQIDLAARELYRAGLPVALPPKSFDCLGYLIAHRERAVGRDELISAVWGRVDVNDALHMSGLTPLDAGDFPSTDPSARCYVRYGGTLTEIGSDDGRVLVRYDSPMFDSGDLRAVHDDPYGTNPPFSLPCFDGTVAFVQGADLFN